MLSSFYTRLLFKCIGLWIHNKFNSTLNWNHHFQKICYCIVWKAVLLCIIRRKSLAAVWSLYLEIKNEKFTFLLEERLPYVSNMQAIRQIFYVLKKYYSANIPKLSEKHRNSSLAEFLISINIRITNICCFT